MLVTRSTFHSAVEEISQIPDLAIDTETTGLRWWKANLFSIIIAANRNRWWYFNFNPYPPLPKTELIPEKVKGTWEEQLYTYDSKEILLLKEHKEEIGKVLSDPKKLWYLVNAKFDMHFLENEGIKLGGKVHCCSAIGRVIRNDLLNYGMDAMAKRWLQIPKSDEVKDYCDKNKLFTLVQRPGKKQKSRNYFFHKVPLHTIVKYAGPGDGVITSMLGRFQEDAISRIDLSATNGVPKVAPLVENEIKLTRVLYDMERVGVLLDIDYVKEALAYETEIYKSALKEYQELSGIEFSDHPARHAKALRSCGIDPAKNEKGNPTFSDEVLSTIEHPIAKAIQRYRASHKKAGTYYHTFLELADSEGVLHTNWIQYGTATGRLSCRDPALQTLEKEAAPEDKYHVRRSFIQFFNFLWFCPDYDQMEYRMMLDYAGEKDVIAQVLDGMDVHQAMADMVGISRDKAKMLNFLLLYGGGKSLLASALSISEKEAKELIETYFGKLPNVAKFVETVRHIANTRGWTYNWMGRRYSWPKRTDGRDWYTQPPNYLIQGGCSDVTKIAMVKISEMFKKKKARSRIQLTIHDEIPTGLHKDELELAPEIIKIMEEVYPFKYVPLTAGPEYSTTNLGDKIKGLPN